MGEILAAIAAKLASLLTGWLWKKNEEAQDEKHREVVDKGVDAIAQQRDEAVSAADAQLAQGSQLANDVRAAGDGAGGLRAGSDALQRAIDESKGGVR